MKRIFFFFTIVLIISCGRRNESGIKIISVSIAPFKYFVEEIAGSNFTVNVMVPPGANPHIYEPFPDQVSKLSQSVAYISDGYLGFEMTWLDRFYEINRNMKKLSLGDNIEPIKPEHHREGELFENADPHYWVSPLCAMKMASSVREFLAELDPQNSNQYDENYKILTKKINKVDSIAKDLSSSGGKPWVSGT
jgi:zinc transport system substrate-binding protein